MIEVAPSLFVGAAADVAQFDKNGIPDGWHVITAARDPWHRDALGYYGQRGAPKDSPEYLIAHRPNRTILNLVDVADPAYIRDEIIDVALGTIDMHLAAGEKVLIHCNEGKSRAPTIAMLWMTKNGLLNSGDENWEADILPMFESKYPDYAPAEGMRLYAQQRLGKMLSAA